MSEDKCYLRAGVDPDGRLMLYDQDGRALWGITELDVQRKMDSADRATITLYLNDGRGSRAAPTAER